MNDQLFERLLNEDESTSLDFKEAQYPLTDHESKSELIKDILSFANSWRRTEAYILIGVREVKGGRSQVIGVTHQLNDNDIQQMVNSKTQRPIDFACETFVFESKPIGVIRIPRQERPFYLKARFGKLEKESVYIRRGSSTDIADPDEVARMGAADRAELLEEQPALDVQFCDPDQHTELGGQITYTSEALQVPADNDIPDYGTGGGLAAALSSYTRNPNFYRDVAKRVWADAMFRPVALLVRNLASVTADDVRVKVTIPGTSSVTVLTQGRYPSRPDPSGLLLHGLGLQNLLKPPPVKIEPYGKDMIVTTHLGKIQPKDRAWSAEPFFIGTVKSQKLALATEVSADTLREPVRTSLDVEFHVSRREITVDQLYQLAEKFRRQS